MADYDFEPPSFSLGLDFDLPSQPQVTPPPDPIRPPAKRPSTAPNLRPIEEDDDDFESPVIRVSEPPRALKRLRRVTTAKPSTEEPKVKSEKLKVKSENHWCNVDDEIEDFSSDEDRPRVAGSIPTNSVCSSSKPSLHGKKVVTSESGTQWISRKGKESASASINVDTRRSNGLFPKLTLSPLRRFQLIDSDSDDPSTIENTHKETPCVILSPDDKTSDYCKEATIGNQGTKTSIGKHPIKDFWKDFGPGKSSSIPTPAFDEFCKEYFTGLNNKSVPKIDTKQTGSGMNRNKTSLPPAHFYFFHNDSRIQKLVRERLPHFFPLEVGSTQEDKQHVSVIDYMGQFGAEQKKQTSGRQNVEKNTKRGRKNTKNSQVDGVSEHSAKWVNPKSCAGPQKNARSGKAQAASGSSGHWYTGQDGRRVYVTKNGQELSGQIAYRHYRKESGMASRNSKKKTAAKKKPASKKPATKK